MSDQRLTAMWQVVEPSQLPSPVARMSFSTLLEIEECPKRWSLSHALYPSIWDGRGYPRVPHIAAMKGTVVHSAIEKIAIALTENGCKTVHEEGAVKTLKTLGGYTTILRECVESALRQHEVNPRAINKLDSLRRQLDAGMPELRSRVQRQIARIKLAARAVAAQPTRTGRSEPIRVPISSGTHAEIELHAAELGWYGIIDLLTLAPSHCELRDFKTGACKEQHRFQLQVYSLLWARDREVNPSGQLADRLVLSYDDHEVEVATPDAEELLSLESELRERTAAVTISVTSPKPRANPGNDTCRYCSVRQLCSEYWQWRHGPTKDSLVALTEFTDLEVTVTRRHGPSSWDVALTTQGVPDKTCPVLLRTKNLHFDLQPGQQIRILNVHLMRRDGDDEQGASEVATMGTSSEVFVVPK